MSHAAQEIIISGVNESRFLEHLRTMFSTSTTMLAELLQNSRRAGATSVAFNYEDADNTLIVQDNGCGIADFRALITVAESGWSGETMATDKPFGIGFFSVAFGCQSVLIESRGRQTEFCSDDLITKRAIIIQPSSFIGGTRLTLRGCHLTEAQVGGALRAYAKGFSIPVSWKEEDLPRPHARENLPGEETPVGFVSIQGLHFNVGDVSWVTRGKAYCQGLPVTADGFTSRWEHDSDVIIHVDHHRFKPRMPDRDSLIDGVEAGKAFQAEAKRILLEHMVTQKALLSPETFVEKYWTMARELDAFSIMSDVPALPKEVLAKVSSYPVQRWYSGSFTSNWSATVRQEQVLSGEVVLCSDLDYYGKGDEFAKLMYAWMKGWCLVSRLPEGHWALPHIIDLDAAEVKISGNVVAEELFSGRYANGPVKLFDRIVVLLNGQPLEITKAFAVGSNGDYGEMTFLVPRAHACSSDVLRQASTYTNDDVYQETDLAMDEKEFDDMVAVMAGETPEETLKKCLRAGDADARSNLRNMYFTVSIDENGDIAVTEAAS